MERRELFRILTVTALAGAPADAQHDAHTKALPASEKAQAPRFFSAVEYKTLEQVCELLLPSDSEGPGAKEAGVAAAIDTILYYADARLKQSWRSGIAAIQMMANGKPLASIMDSLAENESTPKTEAERFFGMLKRAAVEAFGASTAGRQFFGYRGDTAIPAFTGCTHPEHLH